MTGEMQKSYPVSADAFSPDGRWMGWIDFVAIAENRVVISDVATGREKQNLALANDQAIYFKPALSKQFAMTNPMSSKRKLCRLRPVKSEHRGGIVAGINRCECTRLSGMARVSSRHPYADHSIKCGDVASGQERRSSYGQAMCRA